MNFILAAADPNAFWNTGAGNLIKTLLAAGGVVLVLVAVLKAFGSVTKGKMGEAAKILLASAVFATFLFRPETLTDLVQVFGKVVESLIGGSSELVDQGTTQAPPG